MPTHRALLLVSLAAASGLAAPPPLAATIFRVGNDGIPPCTHSTLAAAVAAAAANGTGLDQIYLSDPVTISSPLEIVDSAVEIVGGFSDCNDDTPSGRTAVTATANPTFYVHGSLSARTVNLQGLTVLRSGAGGRLLQIEDAALVGIYDSLLSSGQASSGANVSLVGASAYLILYQGTAIYNGTATGAGGGIYCSGGTVAVAEGATVSDNAAADRRRRHLRQRLPRQPVRRV